MWQREDDLVESSGARPDSWAAIRRRIDRRLVGAYCAMRFDGHTRERVMDDVGLATDEVEDAIRRGAEVYGHDVEDALSWVGKPRGEAERRLRRHRLEIELRPRDAALADADRLARRRLSGFFTARD